MLLGARWLGSARIVAKQARAELVWFPLLFGVIAIGFGLAAECCVQAAHQLRALGRR